MTRMNVAAQFYFGYYYFFPQKSNSDLCCNCFSVAETVFSSAARVARAALLF